MITYLLETYITRDGKLKFETIEEGNKTLYKVLDSDCIIRFLDSVWVKNNVSKIHNAKVVNNRIYLKATECEGVCKSKETTSLTSDIHALAKKTSNIRNYISSLQVGESLIVTTLKGQKEYKVKISGLNGIITFRNYFNELCNTSTYNFIDNTLLSVSNPVIKVEKKETCVSY